MLTMNLFERSEAAGGGIRAANGAMPRSLLAVCALLFASTAWCQPTAREARAFVAEAERELAEFSLVASRAAWVNLTHITDDTNALAAHFSELGTELSVRLAKEAARFNDTTGLDYDTRRKLNLLRGTLVLAAPDAPGAAAELSEITTRLVAAYGTGRGTHRGVSLPGNELEALMGTVRDPGELEEMWTSWHAVGRDMKSDYVRMVEIANAGANGLGFADTGAMWRSAYDMPPDEFAELTETLWQQVKPLYDELHTYVRRRLHEHYGAAVQPATGPIRSHLLGNMWAQEWGNIYDLVAPAGAGDIGYDLTGLLQDGGYDAVRIVKTGEGFFSSLGFDPLPATFWQRSMITRPEGREVVCHASAWNVDAVDDLRIKMCTKVNAEDFGVVHHELGHNYYQRAYNAQPYLYQDSANDGLHEAIGDMVTLSITPEYLAEIGLLSRERIPSEDKDIGLLLRQALDRVAFLPFGLLIDRWRWGVFDGSITPDRYNAAWNEMRLQYQGVMPPVERAVGDFDPGAKYHVPGNTPYTRYFLARILQFQLYQAACEQAGWQGPLHRCSFYGDEEVGARLEKMLAMGMSRPWPDALEAFTGQRDISGEAMLAYFAPLHEWLKAQNAAAR